MIYDFGWEKFSSDATADVYLTAAGCHATDTVGHRYKIREIDVHAADPTPLDKNLAVKLGHILDVSAGGAGTSTAISAANLPKRDSGQIDAPFGAGVKFTGEPTTYKTDQNKQWEFNAHSGLIYGWAFADAPVCNRDEMRTIRLAPRVAGAIITSGSMAIETF